MRLSERCEFVYVVQNLDFLTGESSLAKILEGRDNVGIVYSSVVKEIVADDIFKGIVVENTKTGIATQLDCDGMFVAIGQVPENEPFGDMVALNDYGYIDAGEDCIPNAKSKGIFAAGDCRTKAVRQVTTATADGAVAALAACRFIDSL